MDLLIIAVVLWMEGEQELRDPCFFLVKCEISIRPTSPMRNWIYDSSDHVRG